MKRTIFNVQRNFSWCRCSCFFFANIRSAENSRLTNISLRVLSPLLRFSSFALRAVRLQLCPLRSPSLSESSSCRCFAVLRLFRGVRSIDRACQLDALHYLFFTSNALLLTRRAGERFEQRSRRLVDDVAVFAISPEK